ncbi:hypothetical protein LOK49_LG11G01450 [Camellia lanceoleosa]|uniref:Uncharacterized protein n=1 Tax=Camellia lanceoleosa TaxID=1840588 RepID=A0ACC0FXB5_9ERIC|nr:hypothetical protein LOK49_LG11G01450 [Camellia lanceoleosa]
MDSSISQPNPLNNHHHKATTATNNNDDYQVVDPDLTNMIGRDLNFMKETMTQIQKFVDHMNVQINQACEKFEELKTRGGSDTNELDQLKMSVKKLKSIMMMIQNHIGNHGLMMDPLTVAAATTKSM